MLGRLRPPRVCAGLGQPPRLWASTACRSAPAIGGDRAESGKVLVKFQINYKTEMGESLALVGDVEELGSWSPDRLVKMQWHEGYNWCCSVSVPAGAKLEYKYVLVLRDGSLSWAPGFNYKLEVAGTAGATMDVFESWSEDQPRQVDVHEPNPERASNNAGEKYKELGLVQDHVSRLNRAMTSLRRVEDTGKIDAAVISMLGNYPSMSTDRLYSALMAKKPKLDIGLEQLRQRLVHLLNAKVLTESRGVYQLASSITSAAQAGVAASRNSSAAVSAAIASGAAAVGGMLAAGSRTGLGQPSSSLTKSGRVTEAAAVAAPGGPPASPPQPAPAPREAPQATLPEGKVSSSAGLSSMAAQTDRHLAAGPAATTYSNGSGSSGGSGGSGGSSMVEVSTHSVFEVEADSNGKAVGGGVMRRNAPVPARGLSPLSRSWPGHAQGEMEQQHYPPTALPTRPDSPPADQTEPLVEAAGTEVQEPGPPTTAAGSAGPAGAKAAETSTTVVTVSPENGPVAAAVITMLGEYSGLTLDSMHLKLGVKLGSSYHLATRQLQAQVLQPLVAQGKVLLEGSRYVKGASNRSGSTPRPAWLAAAQQRRATSEVVPAAAAACEAPVLKLLQQRSSMSPDVVLSMLQKMGLDPGGEIDLSKLLNRMVTQGKVSRTGDGRFAFVSSIGIVSPAPSKAGSAMGASSGSTARQGGAVFSQSQPNFMSQTSPTGVATISATLPRSQGIPQPASAQSSAANDAGSGWSSAAHPAPARPKTPRAARFKTSDFTTEVAAATPAPAARKTRMSTPRAARADPDAPKKNLTAYILFCGEYREECKAANPGAGFGELSKRLAEMWKNADEVTRSRFEAAAAADKQRYEREMQAYTARSNGTATSISSLGW